MKNIFKINSIQTFNMWRNVAYGLIIMALVLLLTYLLPKFLAPIISTAAAFGIYVMSYTESNRRNNCLLHPAAILLILITYTFFLVALNLASLWITSFDIWYELSFFSDPYIPILLLAPVGLITAFTLLIRGQEASVCTDCRLTNGHYTLRGRIGIIFHHEAQIQLKNLILIFSLLTLGTYLYFFLVYNPVNITSRDTFVFLWVPILIFIFDTAYFAIRYYNLYLDLRERDQIVTPMELSEMSSKTWIRYYVICEDSIYLNMHSKDELNESGSESVVETPFIVNRETTTISESEAMSIIRALTGVRDGKLKFFFGRKSPDNFKHSVMRYFYFIPGEPENYPELNDVEGTWISSNKFKTLLYNPTLRFSPLLRTDMTRLATIIITSKTFTKNGERRTKLKQYHPSFNFEELYDSRLDFQNDTWLRVSCFNSNTSHFKLKRMWRNFTRRNNVQVDE